MIKFNNGDLNFDIEKIKGFDAPITVSKSFDDNLDYHFAIDVEDASYWYANEESRNRDYDLLKTVLKNSYFV